MAGGNRSIYVISDLHIGGAYPDEASSDPARKRGFRMMTHPEQLAAFITALYEEAPAGSQRELVINGDFVDFLAEEHTKPRFRPFLFDPGEALETFESITTREGDKLIFDALAAFTAKGHCLTILLGNHDVELSLPDVRHALARKVTGAPGTLRFVYDGEALVYGDALIEHGNAYDPANVVDHEALTRIRGLRSRGYRGKVQEFFEPPPGSKLVASVMNPIKASYGFIDLLKPESEPLFALLVAIAPEYRKELGQAALALKGVPRNALPRFGLPSYLANVSSKKTAVESYEQPVAGGESAADRALREVLASTMDQAAAKQLMNQARNAAKAENDSNEQEVASFMDHVRATISLIGLFLSEKSAAVDERLDMVQTALLALNEDQTFNDEVETGKGYKTAAEELSKKSDESAGFRYVIFGHTHHAKKVKLGSGAWYFNTGTWANLMKFPADLLHADKATARKALRTFVEKVAKNELEDYVSFRPTYVRLDLKNEQRVVAAELLEFKEGTSV